MLRQSGDLFVKPCCLDNKIGIFQDSQVPTLEDALKLSQRIYDLYGDRAIIQKFVDGQDLRVSFLNVIPGTPLPQALGLYWSEERNELRKAFSSYADHFTAFEDWDANTTGKLPEDARYNIPQDPALAMTLDKITYHVERLSSYLGLRDYFGIDFRLGPANDLWFMELNTAPFLRNRGMRDFIQRRYGLEFGAAVGQALLNAFLQVRSQLPTAAL
jgi:hypothetical protein